MMYLKTQLNRACERFMIIIKRTDNMLFINNMLYISRQIQ